MRSFFCAGCLGHRGLLGSRHNYHHDHFSGGFRSPGHVSSPNRPAKDRGVISTELHTRAAAESGRGCIYRHADGVHDKQRNQRPLPGIRIYMRL